MASAIIRSIRTVSGNQPNSRRVKEAATQTFKQGVPIQINAAGFAIEWDGVTTTGAIAGISAEGGANLTTAGVPKQQGTFGSVPNQAAAVNIARGAPINDGRVGIDTSVRDTVFRGQVGPAQSAVQALVGDELGLTKDADGQWFVDTTKTLAADTVVRVVALDPDDTARGVHFVFLFDSIQQV